MGTTTVLRADRARHFRAAGTANAKSAFHQPCRSANAMNSRHANPSHTQRPAFTFIELIVVVAVLAILVSLFLPRLANHNRRSSRISCVNNLKQVGLAFRIFANDHNDQYRKSCPRGWQRLADDKLRSPEPRRKTNRSHEQARNPLTLRTRNIRTTEQPKMRTSEGGVWSSAVPLFRCSNLGPHRPGCREFHFLQITLGVIAGP